MMLAGELFSSWIISIQNEASAKESNAALSCCRMASAEPLEQWMETSVIGTWNLEQ